MTGKARAMTETHGGPEVQGVGMRRSILLALTAVALAAAPAAWADPDHGDRDRHGDHGDRDRGGHDDHGDRDHGDRGWHGDHGDHGDRGWHGDHDGHGRWSPEGEARFDRHHDEAHWGRTRGDWRGAHGDWGHWGAWRGGHDWWRGRSEFRVYAGARPGFWFVPGVGYHHVPPQYWGRHWGYGEILPAFFFQYRVPDWRAYDLPPPPPGCAWVWLNGGVALVDLSDGYIMDVQYGLW